MKEFAESGGKQAEIEKVNGDIAKLQELLTKLDEKNRRSAIGDSNERDR